MRTTAVAGVLSIMAGIAIAGPLKQASAKGFGGMHIGGLGGLHIGGLHAGGFHTGGIHGGGFHGGSISGGSHMGGGMSMSRAGSNASGIHAQSGIKGSASGSSFASRHFSGAGAANAAPGNAPGAAISGTSKPNSSGTFLARHAAATSNLTNASRVNAAAPHNLNSNVAAANHTVDRAGGVGNGSSGSRSPYNLGANFGVLLPSRPGSYGLFYPWLYGNGGYGYAYGPGYPGCYYSYCGYYGLAGYAGAAPLPANIGSASTTANDAGVDFAALGERQFQAGNYQFAVNDWRHAVLDDTKNPIVVLLLGQALFASQQYDEAAGAVQHAMRLLPEDQWGVVVSHYLELYRGNQDYTDQLRALEAARKQTGADSPAVHFLLGYHYGYLGYPKQAIAELDKTLAIVPEDALAGKLRTIMVARLPISSEQIPVPTR